jgi:hypothetical protein
MTKEEYTKTMQDMDKRIHWDLLVEHLHTFPEALRLKYVESLVNSYSRRSTDE